MLLASKQLVATSRGSRERFHPLFARVSVGKRGCLAGDKPNPVEKDVYLKRWGSRDDTAT